MARIWLVLDVTLGSPTVPLQGIVLSLRRCIIGEIWVYSGLAMKKLCTLLVLLSLAATAAAPPTPTLIVTCDGGTLGGCAQPHFVATNLNPDTTYSIDGVTLTESLTWVSPPAAADGTFDFSTGDLLDAGAWTFELHAIGNNGKPQHKILTTHDVTF